MSLVEAAEGKKGLKGIVPLHPTVHKAHRKIWDLSILLYVLLNGMTGHERSTMILARALEANAQDQNILNQKLGEIHFVVTGGDASQAEIDEANQIDQVLATYKQDLQNAGAQKRQTGQVLMTQSSASINEMQQTGSQATGWLKALNTMFQVIDEMTQNS